QQVHALLMVESANIGNDRFETVSQQEPLAQSLLVDILVSECAAAVPLGDKRVDFRIPHIVVDAIADAAELVGVGPECVSQSEILLGCQCLPSMPIRYSRNEVRVDDTGLGKVELACIEIVAKALVVEVVLGTSEAGRP